LRRVSLLEVGHSPGMPSPRRRSAPTRCARVSACIGSSPFERIGLVSSFILPFRGSDADYDVEAGRQLAALGLLDRLEIDKDEFAVDRVAEAAEHAVGLVLRMAVDEQLRGEQLFAALPDLEVNVRSSARIRDRLDGAEVVFASQAGGEPA